eukprot:2758701-Pleurochrysis_carterae.AAC.1
MLPFNCNRKVIQKRDYAPYSVPIPLPGMLPKLAERAVGHPLPNGCTQGTCIVPCLAVAEPVAKPDMNCAWSYSDTLQLPSPSLLQS